MLTLFARINRSSACSPVVCLQTPLKSASVLQRHCWLEEHDRSLKCSLATCSAAHPGR